MAVADAASSGSSVSQTDRLEVSAGLERHHEARPLPEQSTQLTERVPKFKRRCDDS